MAVIRHIVVDGSNVATEGRQTPSLKQLESALDELRRDLPGVPATVVVDATFAHRIDPSELTRYQELATSGSLVSPPAGAIGRGDAFLLRIAEKVGATVLSNDSFQEFHGEHPWLFEDGRLLGATPVPGIGWIFSARSPVRGPRSRVATRDARRDEVADAIEVATREAVEPESEERTRPRARRSRSHQVSPAAVNDPMTFITFIAEHHLGDELEGEVESFTSHGAVVRFGEVRCYVPLSGLGDPPPRSARGIVSRGERRQFVITALDPYRRGIELALPGMSVVSGKPSEETVEAEVKMARHPPQSASSPPSAREPAVEQQSGGRPPAEARGEASSAVRRAPARARRSRSAPTPGEAVTAPSDLAAEEVAAKAPAVGKAASRRRVAPVEVVASDIPAAVSGAEPSVATSTAPLPPFPGATKATSSPRRAAKSTSAKAVAGMADDGTAVGRPRASSSAAAKKAAAPAVAPRRRRSSAPETPAPPLVEVVETRAPRRRRATTSVASTAPVAPVALDSGNGARAEKAAARPGPRRRPRPVEERVQ